MSPRPVKSLSVYYKQIPIDKWQEHWLEGNPLGQKSRDGLFLSLIKYPDKDLTEWHFNFKHCSCMGSYNPDLMSDTIYLGDLALTNYYKLECQEDSSNTTKIQTSYFTINKGLLAFKTSGGDIWIRQN